MKPTDVVYIDTPVYLKHREKLERVMPLWIPRVGGGRGWPAHVSAAALAQRHMPWTGRPHHPGRRPDRPGPLERMATPLMHPEGVERMWTVARWHNGRLRWRFPPPGLLALACRTGLHFMVQDFILDGYACRCRREQLWAEQIRRRSP